MKKLIVILYIMILAGCSYDNTPQPIPSESQVSEISENIQEETPKSNQEVESKIEVPEEETTQIENPDFRNSKWGMSFDEVKKSEKLKIVAEQENGIIYEDKISDFPVYAIFNFENGKLIMGVYTFKQEHSNNNLFYDDYKKVVELYTKKYGEPLEEYEQWNNDLMKGNPSRVGLAISIGHVNFATKWKTDTSEIGIVLTGDNYKINFGCLYQPIDYVSEANIDGV